AKPARAELADERVDADAVRSHVPRDHEVLRTLAPEELPQPPEGPRINVDIENRVDAVLEGRSGDREPSVRPRAVVDRPFSERTADLPHADRDARPRWRARMSACCTRTFGKSRVADPPVGWWAITTSYPFSFAIQRSAASTSMPNSARRTFLAGTLIVVSEGISDCFASRRAASKMS